MSPPLRFYRLLHLPVLLLLAACALPGPAPEKTETTRSAIVLSASLARARQYGLMDVREAIPDISVDLRYGTRQNVAGRALYPPDMPCLLRISTVKRLQQAQATLRAQGYGIRIWDAWRPPEVHQVLYAHGGQTGMFMDPRSGWSRHCGGVSVDATLVDARGNEMRMPTYFDEDLERADVRAPQPDPVILKNMRTLHSAMRNAGLIPLDGEWWHFDDRDFLYTPIPVVTGANIGVSVRGR